VDLCCARLCLSLKGVLKFPVFVFGQLNRLLTRNCRAKSRKNRPPIPKRKFRLFVFGLVLSCHVIYGAAVTTPCCLPQTAGVSGCSFFFSALITVTLKFPPLIFIDSKVYLSSTFCAVLQFFCARAHAAPVTVTMEFLTFFCVSHNGFSTVLLLSSLSVLSHCHSCSCDFFILQLSHTHASPVKASFFSSDVPSLVFRPRILRRRSLLR